MITIESKGNVIEIFGRKETGEFYKKIDTSFRPYFYVKNPRGEFKTIDGNRASKIILNNPNEIRLKRANLEHYEADIPIQTDI